MYYVNEIKYADMSNNWSDKQAAIIIHRADSVSTASSAIVPGSVILRV